MVAPDLPSSPAETALAALRQVLVEEFEVAAAEIRPEARLADDLDLDSLDGASLQQEIEDRLGVELDAGALQDAETVGDLVAAVAQRLAP